MGTAFEDAFEKVVPLTADEKRTAANRGLGLHHKKKANEGDRAKFEEEIIMLFGRLCAIEKDISKLKQDAGEFCTSYFYGKCDFSL